MNTTVVDREVTTEKESLKGELERLKLSNESLRTQLDNNQVEIGRLKMEKSKSEHVLFQRIQEMEANNASVAQGILQQDGEDVTDGKGHQLFDKDALLKSLLASYDPAPDYYEEKVDDSVCVIYHNVNEAKDTAPFEMGYVHPQHLKSGDFFEVRIEDLGMRLKDTKRFCVGVGVINMTSYLSKNKADYGFDIGYLSDREKAMRLAADDQRETLDCPDAALIPGDVVRCDIGDNGAIVSRNGKPAPRIYSYNKQDKYGIFIGLNNQFGKISLAYNQSFRNICEEPLQKFPKEDLRIYVVSMNEASPRYAAGVADGGKHLLNDGMLVRNLREDGRRIINFQPGTAASTYDAKLGDTASLAKLLPQQLIRNRGTLSGNLVTITRKCKEKYHVIVRSLLSGYEEKFTGTESQWLQDRARLLSSGEKYVINLPTTTGMIQTNNLLICGTKCKTLRNMVHGTLTHKVKDTEMTPAVLLLGGDRSQSIGSIPGTLNAYKDVCVIYFDAHFDFRDPDASNYPVVHGSPLFLLLQHHVRDAISKWREMDTTVREKYPLIRDAIKFLNSTRDGREYWNGLQEPEVGYRGFNWLRDTEEINPKRISFVGVRKTEMEEGSSLGSPLVDLFLHLLHLEDCFYPSHLVRSDGVTKVFKNIIEQFRSTFPEDELRERDQQHPDGKWIPPIMVSWDVDSIDPSDLPCTIYQEENGLSNEECLAFSDEIALTRRLVLMELVEFNPDLWGGYLDESIILTLKDFDAGPYGRSPRKPTDKNKHRFDLQTSTSLLHDIIRRALKVHPMCVES